MARDGSHIAKEIEPYGVTKPPYAVRRADTHIRTYILLTLYGYPYPNTIHNVAESERGKSDVRLKIADFFRVLPPTTLVSCFFY